MYKPKHKRPMELKPNGKVVGLAASAVMLATPILQTAGAVSAAGATGVTDPNQTDATNENTTQNLVKTAEEGTTPAEETTVNLTTLQASITAAKDAITEAGDQVADDSSIVTSADANKVSYFPSATTLATALTTAQGLVTGGSTDADAIASANTGLTTQTKNYQAENTARSELQTLASDTANSLTDSNYSDTKKADITDTLKTAEATLAKAGTSWTATDAQTASQVFLSAIQKNTTAITTAVNADDTGTTTPGETTSYTYSQLLILVNSVKEEIAKYPTGNFILPSLVELNNALNEAASLPENSEPTDVTPVYQTLKTANDSKNATNIESDFKAYQALNSDITDTQNKINTQASSYTPESVESAQALIAATTDSDGVLTNKWTTADSAAFQTQANTAAKNISSALVAATVDKTNLETAISEADKLDEAKYTAASYSAVASALEKANTVSADENATIDQVNTATTELTDAVNKLVGISGLQTVLSIISKLNQADYTEPTWGALNAEVTKANAMISNVEVSATDTDVADEIKALNTAIIGLEKNPETVDKTALTAIVDAANKFNESDYTSKTFDPFKAALATAQATLDDPDATSVSVAAAVTGLNEAIAGLEAEEATVDVDTTALKNLITDAKAVNENDYTEASYGALQKAITDGEAAVATPTVDGVIKAIADLSTAMTGLEAKPDTTVDTTVLAALIAAAERLKLENYTQPSQDILTNALTNARAARDADVPTTNGVAIATDNLNEAIAALKVATVTVDKTALQSMVNKANDVNGANYAPDSYQALQDATTAAQKVLDNADATTQDVTDALTALNTAYANLVETNVAQAKAALQDVLTLSKNYLSVNYTTDSYGVFKAAVNSGQIVYDDDNVTNVDDVTDATNAIKAAIKGLVPLKYGTTVQNIKDLQAKIADLRVWDYTQDTWEALMEANDNATNTLNLGSDATKDQLDSAYAHLNNAFTNLKAVSENNILKQLGDLSTQVQNLNQGQFTDTSWAKLATAQKAAQEILANDNGYNASVASVQNAYDNLQAAVKGLVSVYGDSNQQTDLTNLYKKVQYYTKGSVSDDNWQAFLVARDNAATALKSDDSTVIDYMNAYDALAKAAKTLGSDADMSYIASAAYSEINGVGKVFFEGQGIVLYDKPNGQQVDDADGEGRLLADQTEWKVMRQATLQNGSSWYEVGKNEWVNAKYVMIEEAQVGQIDYLPDMAVNLWNFQPDGLHFTGRRLDNGTAWEMWGSMMINGEQYFNLGANQWVNAQYITVMA